MKNLQLSLFFVLLFSCLSNSQTAYKDKIVREVGIYSDAIIELKSGITLRGLVKEYGFPTIRYYYRESPRAETKIISRNEVSKVKFLDVFKKKNSYSGDLIYKFIHLPEDGKDSLSWVQVLNEGKVELIVKREYIINAYHIPDGNNAYPTPYGNPDVFKSKYYVIENDSIMFLGNSFEGQGRRKVWNNTFNKYEMCFSNLQKKQLKKFNSRNIPLLIDYYNKSCL